MFVASIRNKIRYWAICSLTLCACYSCIQNTSQCDDQSVPNDTLSVSYATGFQILYYDNYKKVTIKNPWQEDEILATYYLVSSDTISTPNKALNVVVPLQKIALTSCTHFEFIDLIDELATIEGICNPELVYNAKIRDKYKDGKIINIGDAFNTNIEKLLATTPNAVIVSAYNQQDENLKRLEAVGIPIIYNNEWTEKTLLGRAEWLKLVAAFYNKEEIAYQIFEQIDSNYNATKRLVEQVQTRPSIMCGGNFKGTWYMPSGQSYMGQLFADAGADYFYANEQGAGSLPLNFEVVLNIFSEASIWLNAPAQTLDELFAMDERHKLFRAAKNGEVYGFYAKTIVGGANDFWESAVAHPDLVLKDILWATHPDIVEGYEPTYIIKLK